MELPGTVNERIGDLRSDMKLSQKELAEMIEVSASQLSRIESGETQSISSETIIKLAKALHVSSDYILGLTTIREPKSYDISELSLSEGAVKALTSGKVDVQMLNRLLEHKSFPNLIFMIKAYFEDTVAAGIMARNDVIDMATSRLDEFAKEKPEHKAEARKDVRFLNVQKIGEHEAEMEKIKNTFLAILKDIKKDIDSQKAPGVTATAEFMKGVWRQLADKPRAEITAEDVSDAVMQMVGRTTVLDEGSAKLFKKLVMGIIGKSGK